MRTASSGRPVLRKSQHEGKGGMRTVQQYMQEHPQELAVAYDQLQPLRHLEIEVRLDWRCNAKCKFCGVWKYSRDGMLAPERWREVFTDLAARGLRYVLFTGGEPMLYPHFFDLIEHVDALGVDVAVITNGSLLTEKRVQRLARLAHFREVTVSLDSPDAQVHDEVRKMRGLFARATNGMARLRRLAPQVGLTVNTVVCADTVATVRDMLSLPVLPDKIRIFPVGLDLPWLNTLTMSPDEGWSSWAAEATTQVVSVKTQASVREWLSDLRREADRVGVTVDIDRMRYQRPFHGICVVPLAHFVIQPDGDVLPCCHIQNRAARIGRLSVQSVAEMFECAEYQNFLRALRPVRTPACFACSRYRAVNESAQSLLATAGRS
jgi:radical SAM protein with 4Fe4S-binding SPASM domain